MTLSAASVPRLLDVIETDILPLTRVGVAGGSKIFGAAILRRRDLGLVVAETNNEVENPLWHGEVHCLKRFYELPERPPERDCVMLATHEPCSMCLSAITWAGFPGFAHFFSHDESRGLFAIPHDLNILSEVFGLAPGGYRRDNAYWRAHSIPDLAATAPEPERAALAARMDAIRAAYAALSQTYQAGKEASSIPLA